MYENKCFEQKNLNRLVSCLKLICGFFKTSQIDLKLGALIHVFASSNKFSNNLINRIFNFLEYEKKLCLNDTFIVLDHNSYFNLKKTKNFEL
ncbi:hypothetical protein BpHYR1_007461 [Brachionus plicatilis]|uniref:Uncharacterized protein n=1 Tax=Brachionus plicatilis TaxID=10195 RepID=A0A3M7Q6J8_BRAPC|nr:hypothetical protein BpHYR1_007461 [Brachionus plicatilis]